MKCPKCGSEVKSFGGKTIKLNVKNGAGIGYIPEYVCGKCKININEYQARLDKVLAKFECEIYEDGSKDCILSLNKNFGLSIQFDNYYNRNTFTLCGDMGQDNTNYIEITLNTVESLIKDKEENNEM